MILIAIGLAVAALFVVGGGFYVSGVLDKRRVRQALRAAATRAGINPDWLDAIAKQESGWNPQAVNLGPADAKYGGAYGLTQMLWTNVQKMGWTGTKDEFLANPQAQIDLAIRFAVDGPRTSASDFAAWWNSGKRTVAAAPSITKTDYLPKYASNLTYVQQNPV
jgi:hypothetical protein